MEDTCKDCYFFNRHFFGNDTFVCGEPIFRGVCEKRMKRLVGDGWWKYDEKIDEYICDADNKPCTYFKK